MTRLFTADLTDRFMNAEAYTSLQIIQAETHPASHYQGPTKSPSGSKEGLSVYGLFQHLARSPQGKYRLRQIFLRPTLDMRILNERLDTIAVLLRPDNQGVLEDIYKCLKQIKNMRAVMINLQKGASGAADSNRGIRRSIWHNLARVSPLDMRGALLHLIIALVS